jgi:hypothetical protein
MLKVTGEISSQATITYQTSQNEWHRVYANDLTSTAWEKILIVDASLCSCGGGSISLVAENEEPTGSVTCQVLKNNNIVNSNTDEKSASCRLNGYELGFACQSCEEAFRPPPDTPAYRVAYKITSSNTAEAIITYNTYRGGTQQGHLFDLDRQIWEAEVTFYQGEALPFISVRNGRSEGSVTCQIIIEGNPGKPVTSETVATCEVSPGES